jgi:hypothetical protein
MADIQVDLGHGRNAGGQHQRRCNSRNLLCCRTCSVLTTSAVFTTKSTFSQSGEATSQARKSRSLLKCPAAPPNSGLRWVEGASHEYVPSRGGGMRSEQRNRTAQAALPPGLRRFFAFPALLVHYLATAGRVCALLAPWKDEKAAATRHGLVFQQAPTQQRKPNSERPAGSPIVKEASPAL